MDEMRTSPDIRYSYVVCHATGASLTESPYCKGDFAWQLGISPRHCSKTLALHWEDIGTPLTRMTFSMFSETSVCLLVSSEWKCIAKFPAGPLPVSLGANPVPGCVGSDALCNHGGEVNTSFCILASGIGRCSHQSLLMKDPEVERGA